MKPARTITIATALLLVWVVLSLNASAYSPRGVNDAIRGGLMWDKWWAVNSAPEPTGDHPLYPAIGQKSGSTTFRCKECHGWDYKGADGAYASGSHFTGIPGVFGSTLTPTQMFEIIQLDDGAVTNGHGFGALGMSDQDINDVVEFLQTLVIDTDTFIDGTNQFLGNETQGEINYVSGGSISCIVCHGADGTSINFGSPDDPEWVGTLAVGNPWEVLHKIRFGHPNSAMPSWLEGGADDQGAADIGLYAQLNFPDALCGPADLVPPFGLLDIFDIIDYLALFDAMDPRADLVAPVGVWDIFDIIEYLALFDAGCP